MPMAPAVAAGVAAATTAAGTAMQGVGMAMDGGGGGTPQVSLPPEMEAQQLEQIQNQIQQAQEESERAGYLADSLTERANVLEQVSGGFIPYSEGANTLTKINQDIAEKYGAETLNVLGFAQELREEGERLLGQGLEDFEDPRTEREINETKRVMEEQLARDLGPDWRRTEGGRRALATFNESTDVMRRGASREMRTEELGRLSTLTGVGSEIGRGVFQGAGFGQDALTRNLSAMEGMYEGAATRATVIGANRLEYGKVGWDMMQQYGAQDRSGAIDKYVKEGESGFGEFRKRHPVEKNLLGGDAYVNTGMKYKSRNT